MGIVAVEGGNSMLVLNLEDEKNSSPAYNGQCEVREGGGCTV